MTTILCMKEIVKKKSRRCLAPHVHTCVSVCLYVYISIFHLFLLLTRVLWYLLLSQIRLHLFRFTSSYSFSSIVVLSILISFTLSPNHKSPCFLHNFPLRRLLDVFTTFLFSFEAPISCMLVFSITVFSWCFTCHLHLS